MKRKNIPVTHENIANIFQNNYLPCKIRPQTAVCNHGLIVTTLSVLFKYMYVNRYHNFIPARVYCMFAPIIFVT